MKSNNTIESEEVIAQLRAENELKTKWLSLIAHDFKGLFSNIQMLLDAFASNSITQELFMSMLPELKQIAEKNAKTLNSTFVWVNSQADGFRPHIEVVVVCDLLLELQDELSESISLKELSMQYIGDKALYLCTDKLLLKFILKQIIENAIKYLNKNGAIEVVGYADSERVNITVKDNGVGMKDSSLSNIGTLDGAPYTGTLDEKGAGLSLVIVRDFVEMLKGTMHVSSILGEGTSVELEFSQE